MKLPYLSRRKVLQAIALIGAGFQFNSTLEAIARPRGITAILSGSAFNNGRSQTNFNFLGNGEYPFLNHLKEGGTWRYITGNSQVVPTDLVNYYPSIVKNGGAYFVTNLPSQLSRPGYYVLSAVGNGTLYIGSTNTAASYSVVSATKAAQCVITLSSTNGAPLAIGQEIVLTGATGTGWSILNATQKIVAIDITGLIITIDLDTSAVSGTLGGTITATNTKVITQGYGRYVFMPGQNDLSINVGITGANLAASNITDMKLYHIDDEADILAGRIFGKQFKAKLAAANFGVYRNLNWPNLNTSHITSWSTRRPINYPTYNSVELRPSLYCPIVSVSGAQLTVTGNGQDVPASGGPSERLMLSFQIPVGISSQQKSVVTFDIGTSTVNWLTPISGATNNGSGLIRLTVRSTVGWTTGDVRTVSGVGGTVEANGTWAITVIDATKIDLQGSAFINAYTSGGNITGHNFSGNESIGFAYDSGSSFPTPLLQADTYYVLATGLTPTSFQISKTPSGSVVTFSGSQSGTFTANVNVEILLNGTTRVACGDASGTVIGSSTYPVAGDYVTAVYDAVFNKYLLYGGGANGNVAGIDNGIPPEIFLQLCIEMGAHPYWVLPYLAGDPMTDWMPSLMQMHKTSAPSWMIPRFEGTNETWNTAGGFFQTIYAINRGAFYGWGSPSSSSGYHNYYGKLMSVLGQVGAAIFGGVNLKTSYHIICGVQTAAFTSLPITSQNPRLTSAQYVSSGVAQAPLVGSWGTITFTAVAANTGNIGGTSLVSHVAVAQYTSSPIKGTLNTPNPTETALAARANGNVFAGSISGSVLTVTLMKTAGIVYGTGLIAVGDTIYGNGVPNGTTVVSLGTGVGGTGTYNLSTSVPVNISSQDFVTVADLTAGADYVDTFSGSASSFATVEYVLANTSRVQIWAAGLGVNNICGYEGCYSPDYSGTNGIANVGKTQLDIVRWSGKNASSSTKYPGPNGGLQKQTKDLLDGFVGLTGSGLIAEFPSNYLMGGPFPSIYVWSILEDIYANRPSPQWDAHSAFNQ